MLHLALKLNAEIVYNLSIQKSFAKPTLNVLYMYRITKSQNISTRYLAIIRGFGIPTIKLSITTTVAYTKKLTTSALLDRKYSKSSTFGIELKIVFLLYLTKLKPILINSKYLSSINYTQSYLHISNFR
jgi:hypothetical protein